jgi:hypothetical protein
MSKALNPAIVASASRIASFRTIWLALALAAPLLLGPKLIAAQEQPIPPSETRYRRAPIPAPVGHRQPRAADIPQDAEAAVDPIDKREKALLDRKLMICRGC